MVKNNKIDILRVQKLKQNKFESSRAKVDRVES